MKIATFNIQNLFHRDRNLTKKKRQQNRQYWHDELENLLINGAKTERDYRRMRELAILLGFNKSKFEPYFSIGNIDGNLMVDTSPLNLYNRASEISEWNGWIELATNPIAKNAILNKAKVIIDADPDILFLQEVENRASLKKFHDLYLKDEMTEPFFEIVYMEGNDLKGKGMGVLLKKGYRITGIRSFANELDVKEELLFDKNVLQFRVTAANGEEIYVISCQLIAESDSPKFDNKRKRQVAKIATIIKGLQGLGYNNIVVLGNLNAPCYSNSLSPLLRNTELRDVVKHDSFEADFDLGDHSGYYRMGAYRKGINIKQKDYLLFSPALFEKVNYSGLNRKAVWPSNIPKWPLYESINAELDAASDYPLLWADIKLEYSVRLFKKSA